MALRAMELSHSAGEMGGSCSKMRGGVDIDEPRRDRHPVLLFTLKALRQYSGDLKKDLLPSDPPHL